METRCFYVGLFLCLVFLVRTGDLKSVHNSNNKLGNENSSLTEHGNAGARHDEVADSFEKVSKRDVKAEITAEDRSKLDELSKQIKAKLEEKEKEEAEAEKKKEDGVVVNLKPLLGQECKEIECKEKEGKEKEDKEKESKEKEGKEKESKV